MKKVVLCLVMRVKTKRKNWVKSLHYIQESTPSPSHSYLQCSDTEPIIIEINVIFPTLSLTFTQQHQYAYSPSCSLLISSVTDKENLFNNQELLEWVVISCILKKPQKPTTVWSGYIWNPEAKITELM